MQIDHRLEEVKILMNREASFRKLIQQTVLGRNPLNGTSFLAIAKWVFQTLKMNSETRAVALYIWKARDRFWQVESLWYFWLNVFDWRFLIK